MTRALLGAALAAILFPLTAGASGSLDRGGASRTYEVRWFNASGATVLAAEKDPVAQAIQRRFNVKLILQGGPLGSNGYRLLAQNIAANASVGPNDARRKVLPDVFPWPFAPGAGTGLSALYAPLSFDQIKKYMPRTWTDIQVLSRKSGSNPDLVWAPFMDKGVPYAIPQPTSTSSYPSGVIWRADILARLGLATPTTIEAWDAVFRAYKKLNPDSVPWANVTGGAPFLAVFDATGVPMDGFIMRDRRIQLGLVQPEIARAIVTLAQWYDKRYITASELGTRGSGKETNALFVSGLNIVTTDAHAEDGSWICTPPYVGGSLQEQTLRRVPDATFVMAPRPVYGGVTFPAAPAGGVFGVNGFGFNAELADNPDKLVRVMRMVEALANDRQLYLTGMFGILGTHWTWDTSYGEPYPRRLPSVVTTANTGRYWILPYTSLDEQYLLSPRVLDSISRFYSTGASFYGRGTTSTGVSIAVPYGDSGASAMNDKDRFQYLATTIWDRFYRRVLGPIVTGRYNGALDSFDAFVAWYHDSGSDEIERIVARWARGAHPDPEARSAAADLPRYRP